MVQFPEIIKNVNIVHKLNKVQDARRITDHGKCRVTINIKLQNYKNWCKGVIKHRIFDIKILLSP